MSTILVAIGVGVLVLLAGNMPFYAMRAANLAVGTAVPWAILPAALYLWAYWRFIGGRLGAGASAATRRQNLRANTLSLRVWGASLAAGLIGFGSLVALLVLAARLVHLPASSPIVTPPGTVVTALALLSMASIVAGVTEEAAFRGYMQSPIERRYGLATAILVNGAFFGLLHFPNHPGADVLWMLPYYIAVSAVYGGLTSAANSILPALVLHVAGDIVVLTRWWLTDRPEWQIGPTQPPLVWESGIDWQFVLTAIASTALVAATTFAFRAVRTLRAKEHASSSSTINNNGEMSWSRFTSSVSP